MTPDPRFETLREEWDNLPDVLMVGPPALDESLARFDAALRSLEADYERDREMLGRLVGWLSNYYTEAPPEFEADVDAARAALADEETEHE